MLQSFNLITIFEKEKKILKTLKSNMKYFTIIPAGNPLKDYLITLNVSIYLIDYTLPKAILPLTGITYIY